MPSHPFYHSKEWHRLRGQALKRDRYRCTAPGCRHTRETSRLFVDHIKPRAQGGSDTLDNVRTLCQVHDNQVKEDARGVRRSGGKLTIRTVAVGVDGWPTG
jgi:5-methylcytosine-specific restriction enzyme A